MAEKEGNERGDPLEYDHGIPILNFRTRLSEVERKAREAEANDTEYKTRQTSTNKWMMIFTGMLFLTSVIAGGISIWQTTIANRSAKAAESAAKTANDTLTLDQRPWVGVMGSNHISAEIVKGSPMRVRVEIQNVGKTPALDEIGIGHLTSHLVNTPMPNFNDCSKEDASAPVTLMPNAVTQVSISTEIPGTLGVPIILTDADITLINNEQVQLFIYGCTWYKDTFNKNHRTDYCFQYIPATRKGGSGNSFAACPIHNYAD